MKKVRDFFNKRRLRRTCTLEDIRSDVSFKQPPPDGGWGWVVVAAAATHCLLVSGFHSAFGVYMLPLLDTFESSNWQIAWIGSISYALMMFGPVSGKLLVKYGAIKVAIVGDLVTIGGLVWSSYTEKFKMLFFTRGIVVGVGSSLAYTPGVIYDAYGNYTIAFLVTGVCNIGAAGILALIPSLQTSSVQATKNYINASVCVITNTIVPWQSPSISYGSITSSFTKSMISPAASTSGHSKGFSMKSFKSILKSDTTSVKMTSEPRTSMDTVEYMKAFPEQKNDTAEGKSELASVQSQTSISMTQELPIPCKKEDVQGGA